MVVLSQEFIVESNFTKVLPMLWIVFFFFCSVLLKLKLSKKRETAGTSHLKGKVWLQAALLFFCHREEYIQST